MWNAVLRTETPSTIVVINAAKDRSLKRWKCLEIYVGTSGWLYDWNKGSSLDWYVKHSALNAVELNASFYMYPYLSLVKSWSVRGRTLRWAIKVHNSITHLRKLSQKALSNWLKFRELFKPMDELIDFYLFQLPPSMKACEENLSKVKAFAQSSGLKDRFAIEFRHESWFNDKVLRELESLGVTVVSIDSPIGTFVWSSNKIVYLRMHGRGPWYTYNYSMKELEELASYIIGLKPLKLYVFFNNNHWMLDNAKSMLNTLNKLL